ncbi:MAG: hypothetical protein FJ313_03985, partial [Gemmatimonadetes bacterium]|nr:hypothetical protein [Gemmatimonadota bacterium]
TGSEASESRASVADVGVTDAAEPVTEPVQRVPEESTSRAGGPLLEAFRALRRRRAGETAAGAGSAAAGTARRRRPDPIDTLRASLVDAGNALRRVDAEASPLLAELGIAATPTLRELEEAAVYLADEIERRSVFDRTAREADEVRWTAQRAEEKEGQAGAHLDEARRNASAAEEEWSGWLRSRGFAADLRPAVVHQALGTIRELRELLDRLREERSRIADMQTAIDEIEVALRGFAGTARLSDFEARAAAPALAELADRSDRAKRAADVAARLHRESKAWEEAHRSLEDDLAAARHELDALLATADARDVDEFRQIAEGVERRRALSEQLAQLQRASPYLSGPLGREVAAELRSTAHEAVQAEQEERQAALQRLDERRSELDRQWGELEERRERLSGAPRTAGIQEELGKIEANARDAAARWAVLTLASRLVVETIDQFRKERQPEQLKRASDYFRQFTGGRYTTVRPCLGGGRDAAAFEAVLASAQVRQVSELSRATAEQLYLALRFAIIEDFAARNEPLPVLMDDVLVNFDPVRARAACLAIARLSARFQVLVLTCHPETVEWFREAAPEGGAGVIEIAP